MRRLIINADDFGFSPGIDRGIIEAHRAGTLPSTSLLATGSAFDDAIGSLAGCPTLDVGLHFDLTMGSPLTAARSLTDQRTGRFHTLPSLIARLATGQVDRREVIAEWRAQFDRLIAAGARPTHLDGHHHVHALPLIWGAVVEAAQESGAAHLPHRVPSEPLAIDISGWRGQVKAVALRGAWRLASARAPAVHRPDHFRGLGVQGGRDVLTRLLALVDLLPQGTTELMMHPGYSDGVPTGDAYTWQRERELSALTSPELRARLGRGDVVLTSFAAL
ncbi:MAG: ChbG/HpnK family deacetylase [Gemmatimonadota bacterium]|nr:ChbG/HpnK family deacetylase [Gemmatimonadota bacterium]